MRRTDIPEPRILMTALWATISISTLFTTPAAASVWNAETGAIAEELMNQFAQSLDQRIEKLRADAETKPPGSTARNEIEQNIAQTEKARNYYARVETGVALYSGANDVKNAINDIVKAAASGASDAINPDLIAGAELQKLSSLKALETANSALDYYNKLVALKNDVDRISVADLSPATRRLATGLSVMTRIMAEFGDQIPFVGEVVKGYGQVGGGMIDALMTLNRTLIDRQQGLLMDAGNTGLFAEMARAVPDCPQRGDVLAEAVAGLPGVFRSNCHVLIWDDSTRSFVNASDAMPGQSLDRQVVEIRDRHLRFIRNGVPAPTPNQLTCDYDRIILLSINPSDTFVTGNQNVRLWPSAIYLKDDRPVDDRLSVKWSSSAPLLQTGSAGTFVEGPAPALKQQAIWTSPQIDGGECRIRLALSDDRMLALRPAEISIQIGQPTRLDLTLDPGGQIPPGGTVRIRAALMKDDNTPLKAAQALGDITVSCAECGDEAMRLTGFSESENRVHSELWRVPTTPGTYRLLVAWAGSGYGRHGLAPTMAGYQFEVLAPKWEFTANETTSRAAPETPAHFVLTVANRDQVPLDIHMQVSTDRTEHALWRVTADVDSFRLDPSGTREIALTMQPLSQEATSHRVRVFAHAGLPVSPQQMKQLGAMIELTVLHQAQNELRRPSVAAVPWRFGALSIAKMNRKEATLAIDGRLSELATLAVAQSASVARIPGDVDEIVKSAQTMLESSSGDVETALHEHYVKIWYPAWKKIAVKFAADGLSNGTRSGHAALKTLNPKALPDPVLRPDNGLEYYRLLTGIYYRRVEQEILGSLKALLARYTDTAMPAEIHRACLDDLNKRRAVPNGDGDLFAGLGNWLPVESEVCELLAEPPAADIEPVGNSPEAPTADEDFIGTWRGKGAAKMERRTGPVKNTWIQVRKKNENMEVFIEDLGVPISVVRQGMQLTGKARHTEDARLMYGKKVLKTEKMSADLDFEGTLSADKSTMTAIAVYSIFDMRIHHRMALARDGSNAALPPIPPDDTAATPTTGDRFSPVFIPRDAHRGPAPSITWLLASP